MRLKTFASLALAFALPTVAAAVQNGAGGPPGVDVNKDLENRGPVAHDLAIVLAGSQGVTNSFDGYKSGDITGWFDSRTQSTVNGNTVIHWQVFHDGDNDQIDRNQVIHVGYATHSGTRDVLDIYWTDINGNRIPGSVVYDVKANTTYRNNRLRWDLANAVTEAPALSVTRIRYAVLSSALDLGDLSRNNIALAEALIAIDGDLTLAAGDTQSVEIPGEVAPGSAVVLVYEVSAPESNAVVTNYVQTLAQ